MGVKKLTIFSNLEFRFENPDLYEKAELSKDTDELFFLDHPFVPIRNQNYILIHYPIYHEETFQFSFLTRKNDSIPHEFSLMYYNHRRLMIYKTDELSPLLRFLHENIKYFHYLGFIDLLKNKFEYKC